MNTPSVFTAWLHMHHKPLSVAELALAWDMDDLETVASYAEAYASQGLFYKLTRPDGVHYALQGADYLKGEA